MGAGTGGGDEATLTVGSASEGAVRILVEDGGAEIPMDFEPDEAQEIGEELRSAAELARGVRRLGAAAGPARPGGGRR